MRVRTTILFLLVPLALVACGKKDEKAEKPPSAEPRPRVRVEPAQPDGAAPQATPAPPTATTEGLEEGASSDALAEVPAVEIKVGATYVIGQGDQTVVMNPKPVDDGLRRFAKGSVCRYDPEGKVKIVGKWRAKMEDEEVDEYLVRYTREPSVEELRPGAVEYPDATPYECPNGTVFFMEDVSMLEEDEPDERYDAARKLLDSEKP